MAVASLLLVMIGMRSMEAAEAAAVLRHEDWAAGAAKDKSVHTRG